MPKYVKGCAGITRREKPWAAGEGSTRYALGAMLDSAGSWIGTKSGGPGLGVRGRCIADAVPKANNDTKQNMFYRYR